MEAATWHELYESDLQSVYALLVVPALFLAYLAAGGGGRASRVAPESARFMRGYALVFTILALIDPVATGPLLRALPPGADRAAQAIPFAFVLLGDFRVLLLVVAVARPAQGLARHAGEALLLGLIVPLLAAGLHAGLERLAADPPEQTLWLIYEVAFAALAATLAALLPRRTPPADARRRRYLREILLYAVAYYLLWAGADVLILLGVDAGWALRMVPNQLYYALFVPFAYARFFAAR